MIVCHGIKITPLKIDMCLPQKQNSYNGIKYRKLGPLCWFTCTLQSELIEHGLSNCQFQVSSHCSTILPTAIEWVRFGVSSPKVLYDCLATCTVSRAAAAWLLHVAVVGGGNVHDVAVMVVFGSVTGARCVQRRLQIIVLLKTFHRLGGEFQPVRVGGPPLPPDEGSDSSLTLRLLPL